MTTIDGAVYWAVVVSVGNSEKGAAVVRSAALPPEGRGSRTGRSPAVEAKIGSAVASIEHSPAHVDLSGTGLATAIADPEAEAHVA